MPESIDEQLLLTAVAGNTTAAGRLFFLLTPRLRAYVDRRLPRVLTRYVESADVIQDTHIEAFRRIRSFQPDGVDGFEKWLFTIARNQMLQRLRAHRSLKRGSGLTRGDSAAILLEELAMTQHTPSHSAARHELLFAIELGLQRLPNDQAQAVRLRHIERLPVIDVAHRLQRTEHAVHMMCNRGLRQLREHLRSRSRYA